MNNQQIRQFVQKYAVKQKKLHYNKLQQITFPVTGLTDFPQKRPQLPQIKKHIAAGKSQSSASAQIQIQKGTEVKLVLYS